VNLAVEPSFTLSGLRSTAKIHDAENNQSMSSLELVANANASNALGLTPDAGARKRARHYTNLGLSEAVQLSQTI
jgi:hypothetical protein